MALGKKYEDVYDNVTNLTPMARMLREQAARRELENKNKEDEKEVKDDNTNNRKPRSNSGTSK